MAGSNTEAPRSGMELHEASRPFASESLFLSWWYTGSTFVLLLAVLAGAAFVPWWPLRALLTILGGLILVRAFVLYHDYMHGAILRKSRLGKLLYHTFGLATLTPPSSWRYSHNHHHAHVGKQIAANEGKFSLFTYDVGAVPLMTTEMWRQATLAQRLRYRVSRHPVTILCAYVTVFFFSICLLPLLNNPRKFWEGAVSLVVHGGLLAAVWWLAGISAVFFAVLLPAVIAAALGAYLFFAQHNYPGMRVVPIDRWSHARASLESSSFMALGAIGHWFTANIGYHHVHHLNAHIPFYRLPQAMAAIPELQHPVVTTLRPHDVVTCLRLSLWDQESQQLVTFRQMRQGVGVG